MDKGELMRTILSANTPKYSKADNSAINLNVRFEELDDFVPFSAQANDSEPHGRELFARATAGEFGPVEAYVEPAPTAGQIRKEAYVADTSRAEWIDQLKTATPEQIETFVRNKVNADGVTDLASAKACLKRIETGMVTVMKLLALLVKE